VDPQILPARRDAIRDRDLDLKRRGDARSRGPGDAGRAPMSLEEILQRYERLIIIQVLQANDFSRAKAARSLKVSRNSLWRRMQALKIDFSELPLVRTGRPRKDASS
jgi:DNA-binding NtrC family response regulator